MMQYALIFSIYETEQSVISFLWNVTISFQQKAWRLISCTTSWVFPAALQVLMRTDQIWLVSSNRYMSFLFSLHMNKVLVAWI